MDAMKAMKASDLRKLSSDDLRGKVVEMKRELFNLRFQKSAEQIENVARIRHVRRDIARIKTVLGEQQREQVN